MRDLRKLECPICNNKFSISALTLHIHNKHKLDYDECNKIKLNLLANKELQDNVIDDYVNKELTQRNICEKRNLTPVVVSFILYQRNVKFRNAKEAHRTKQYLINYETTSLKNSGYKNPSSNPIIKEKKIRTMLKNHGRINNFQDKEIQERAEKNIDREKSWETIKQTLFLKYGVINFGRVNWREKWNSKIEKMSLEEKEEYFLQLSGRMRKNLHGWTSKLESKVQEVLNDLNIEYINNKYLFGYNYDIIFLNKCILEIQGDFWHANPQTYKEEDILNFPKKKKTAKEIWKYDEKKKNSVEKHGYKVFYIWESQLNNMNPVEIINFITKILNYERT